MRKEIIMLSAATMITACTNNNLKEMAESNNDVFNYKVEQFADLEILRYQVPEFNELPLKQKKLLYYLSQAALEGRDILFDQNGKYNLTIRRTLEAIYTHNKDTTSSDFKAMEVYLKRVWFSNGIHHHYASDKFKPEFSEAFFTKAVKELDTSLLPLQEGESVEDLLNAIVPQIFDPKVNPKLLNQKDGEDLLVTSASNYYQNLTQQEAENFYNAMKDTTDAHPISYGLNSRLVKVDGKIYEKKWKVGGLYSNAITRIVDWLGKAAEEAENEKQKAVIESLISYYRSGDLKTFDDYAILWVSDTASRVDFVNGFTETYGDPLGMKASWESTVNFKNLKATKRTQIISENAQWFEDHSPVDKQFKKEKVKGVSAKVITVAMLGGDCYPSTPIGINLPNSNWIRHEHGSKSVTIENITEAYDKAAAGSGFSKEYAWSEKEVQLMKEYGFITDNLHTDLHECLGHGSGKLKSGVDPDALKAYGSTIEEARADLFALYYLPDDKLVELGLLPNKEAYKAEYYRYMMNGLMTQLTRVEVGNDVEESHMRNRQLIAQWALQNGGKECVELMQKEGKTYVVINNYIKLRELFGQLLAEIQRIKSEGDFEAARQLIETYAVKVDLNLHKEVVERFKPLNIAPYKGFINPRYIVTTNVDNEITSITLDYTEGYTEQMLRYAKDYSSLPSIND